MNSSPAILDYTTRHNIWGHACTFEAVTPGHIKGHLFSPTPVRDNDLLLLSTRTGTGTYQVTITSRPVDPGDLYFFIAERVAEKWDAK